MPPAIHPTPRACRHTPAIPRTPGAGARLHPVCDVITGQDRVQ